MSDYKDAIGFGRRPILGYGVGVAAFAAALALRWQLQPVLPPGFPYLTFFPAVILTAFLAGTGPAILCAVLSGLGAWYFFIPPARSFVLNGSSGLALAFYAFIVSIDIALIHVMDLSLRRLAEQRRVTAGLYDQQRTMFQELQHRVANNMAFVSSLLQLQKRRLAADPVAASAFEEAARRIDTMSRIHRRLYDPAAVQLPVQQYLQEICDDLLEATGAGEVTCRVEASDLQLDIDRLVPLSLLVTEVVTNSIKHAFPAGGAGEVRVRLHPLPPDRLELTISDNGRGQHPTAPAGAGLGTRIVQGLAGQLRGELMVDGSAGMTTRLNFPA